MIHIIVTCIESYECINFGTRVRNPVQNELFCCQIIIGYLLGDSMFKCSKAGVVLAASSIIALAAGAGHTATIDSWNLSNIGSPTDPAEDDGTGYSYIYNGTVRSTEGVVDTSGASSSGRIAFAPPEAEAPGLKVEKQVYDDTGGTAELQFDGCLMTNNPENDCTGGFQSGKRIKQQITGTDPVDLVFDVNAADTSVSFYQVFGRLINATGEALTGFTIELGTGVGDGFQAFSGADAPVTFSTLFTAQPNDSGLSSTSQYPFGLFGAADDSPNFLLDGFFSAARTGFNLVQTETTITSNGYYGDYKTLFGDWIGDADALPEGLFWDFDGDPETDDLLIGWKIGDDEWELRRDVGDTCGTIRGVAACTPGEMLTSFLTGTFEELVNGEDGLVARLADLGDHDWASIFNTGEIEDLANLNLNYALNVGDFTGFGSSFTIRTTVAPVPLPAGAPLLLAGLGAFALVRRKRRAAA